MQEELIISTLRSQRDLLSGLMVKLEGKKRISSGDMNMFSDVLKEVEKNLCRLRTIKNDFVEHNRMASLFYTL